MFSTEHDPHQHCVSRAGGRNGGTWFSGTWDSQFHGSVNCLNPPGLDVSDSECCKHCCVTAASTYTRPTTYLLTRHQGYKGKRVLRGNIQPCPKGARGSTGSSYKTTITGICPSVANTYVQPRVARGPGRTKSSRGNQEWVTEETASEWDPAG